MLNTTLSDNAATIAELEERITHLQRALTSSEHDRRILQERLDTTRYVCPVFSLNQGIYTLGNSDFAVVEAQEIGISYWLTHVSESILLLFKNHRGIIGRKGSAEYCRLSNFPVSKISHFL